MFTVNSVARSRQSDRLEPSTTRHEDCYCFSFGFKKMEFFFNNHLLAEAVETHFCQVMMRLS